MKYVLLIFLLLTATLSFSQNTDKALSQFSGLIYNESNNSNVPYVTIINLSNGNRAYQADYRGYFSFVLREGDTVLFKSIGYRNEVVAIPLNLSEKKYTIYLKMKPEVINLPVVTILPWANIDEFNRDFMTMKFADDDLEIAKKNVSRSAMLALMKNLPRDAGEMQAYTFQGNHYKLSNQNINMRGANPLLNPFVWGALMKQIFDGDKSRSD